MDIIKNPVVLGLFAGVLTFAYISWSKQNESNTKKGKKNKKNATTEQQFVGLIIPAIVAVLIWFIAYGYTSHITSSEELTEPLHNKLQAHIPQAPQGYKLVKDDISSEGVQSFALINKGVKIPTKIPDVFIETF